MTASTARAAAGLWLGKAYAARGQDEFTWRRALRDYCELTGLDPAAVKAELEMQAELWRAEA